MKDRLSMLAALALLALGLLVAAGCGGDDASEEEASPAEDKKVRIGMVLPDLSNEAINDIKLGAEARAQALGNIEVLVAATYSGEDQAKGFENFIAADIDLIGYDSIDAAAVGPAVVKANDAGIPVVGFVSAAAKGEMVSFISQDFCENGRIIGRWMAESLGGEGNVAMVEGNPADAAGACLRQGYEEGLKEKGPDIKLVASAPSNWDRQKALAVATDILTANPNLDGLYGANDDVAMGSLQALKASGREDQIPLAGHNGTCEALRSLLDGELDFTVVLFMKTLGAQFVDTAVKVLNGESVPETVDVPSFGLDTETAKAILDGTEEPPDYAVDLKERLEAADGGCK